MSLRSPQHPVLSTPPAVGRIDVHSHLLPGVDDGCKSVAESIACARILVANGYTHAFCTPHIWPTYKGISRVSVPRMCAALQVEFDKAKVPLKLLPGGEMNIYLGVEKTPVDEVIPLGLGKYMLVDMWAPEIPVHFEPAIRWLQGMGLTAILAHPERMRAVQDRPELIDYFSGLGLLLQGNLQPLGDPPHSVARQCAEHFLKEGHYLLLGSDSHNPEGMEIRVAGLKRAIELVGEAKVNQLTMDNPRALAAELR